jgi:Na+-transporting methylmalonyl-CoA/oxaloacetate decarboxylase gamma subunit
VFGGADQKTKNLIFLGVTFVFAFMRLWATVLILASALKPSDQAAAAVSSSCRP